MKLLSSYWTSLDINKPKSTLFRLLGEMMLVTCALTVLSVALNLQNIHLKGIDPKDVNQSEEFVSAHWFSIGVLVAPLIETLLLQWLVFEIIRRFTTRRWPPFFTSWFLFAAIHFPNSMASGICAGLVGGFYFALTYSLFRPKSVWHAIIATCVMHAAHNFIAFSLSLI